MFVIKRGIDLKKIEKNNNMTNERSNSKNTVYFLKGVLASSLIMF